MSERDFLLRSLDDLDREHAAGDIAEHDYDALRSEYTARAAAALRGTETPITRVRNPWRTAVIAVVVGGAALGTGLLVAWYAGERVGGAGPTGSVRSARATAVATAPNSTEVERLLADGRTLMSSDPVKALKSFDRAATLDPKRVEALAYAGWIFRLVSRSTQDAAQRQELLSAAQSRLDQAVTTDPAYPDARAFRGILRLRDLGDAKGALADFTVLDRLNPPDFVKTLVAGAEDEARRSDGS